jgi:hypothetical protein
MTMSYFPLENWAKSDCNSAANIRANTQDRLIDQIFGPWEPNTPRLPNGGDGTASIAMGTGQRKAIEASGS